MTAPRNVRPGVTWLVTRRATRRHYLFSPDKAGLVEQLYWYATGVYAQQLNIRLHVTQLLSNHSHEVLTDVDGQLPRFLALRNRAIACALKVLRGWPGEVMDATPASWVELETPEAAVASMAYVIANCVEAGLVDKPRRWPGVKVLVDDIGQTVIEVARPDFYFDPDNPYWPDVVTIPIEMPELLEEAFGSHDDVREALRTALAARLREVRAKVAKRGIGFKGVKAILRTKHTARAKSYETFGSRNPTFKAAGDRDVAARMVERLRTFRNDYREAWHAWKTGNRDALFPEGTWAMRITHGVRCHAPP